jgi:SAM-dependent methyltransferase
MSEPESGASRTQAFYTRWARLYDLIASRTPGVGSLRAAAVRALAPPRGGTVVEMGCGTGANFPLLRDAVGSEGTVIGVDFAPGMVERARARVRREGWTNVHVVRGDATRPPIRAAAESSDDDAIDGGENAASARAALDHPDAVFSSFVSGMVADPDAVVRGWADLVGAGGRIGLLDLARSTRRVGAPLNALFGAFVIAGAPSKRGQLRAGTSVLDERVAAAHFALRERCEDVHFSTRALGFARMSAGTVAGRAEAARPDGRD